MRKLLGKHHFKSYKELCSALDIPPAPRGCKREKQQQSIQEYYQMNVQANNSIDLVRIPKKESVRQEKLDRGQIRIIDGKEVDLGSNLLYRDTHIDDLILYQALTVKYRVDTKEGFVINCFERTKFFRELLGRDSLESGKYSVESIHLVHDLVVRRLFAMVNTRLARFEQNGYIRTHRYYLLNDKTEADVEEVQPYVDRALREMGLKSEFQAYASKELREKFLNLRSWYYQEENGATIVAKRFSIEPLIDLEKWDYLLCDDGTVIPALTNKDIQIILTSFFDIFREKAIYDYEQSTKPKLKNNKFSKKDSQERAFRKEHLEEVTEIINTYCAYMNRPLDDPPRAFYSLEELEDYYGENLNFRRGLDDNYSANQDKFDDGDTSGLYDEVDGDGKQQYDFYGLSNLTEEENYDRKVRLERQEKALEEYFWMRD